MSDNLTASVREFTTEVAVLSGGNPTPRLIRRQDVASVLHSPPGVKAAEYPLIVLSETSFRFDMPETYAWVILQIEHKERPFQGLPMVIVSGPMYCLMGNANVPPPTSSLLREIKRAHNYGAGSPYSAAAIIGLDTLLAWRWTQMPYGQLTDTERQHLRNLLPL